MARSQTDILREGTDTVDLPPFIVHQGVLKTNTDLYWELLEEFEEACGKLLRSTEPQLLVDLTSVIFISSSFLGCLNNLVLKATRQKKRINLKVTQDVSWLFDIMGGRRNMTMEIV